MKTVEFLDRCREDNGRICTAGWNWATGLLSGIGVGSIAALIGLCYCLSEAEEKGLIKTAKVKDKNETTKKPTARKKKVVEDGS